MELTPDPNHRPSRQDTECQRGCVPPPVGLRLLPLVWLAVLILGLGLFLVSRVLAQPAEPPSEMVDGDPMFTLGPVGMIPAIDSPRFVDGAEAAAWMQDDEVVLGLVTPEGEPRAYSTWHLDQHEIVNDLAGEIPLATTW